MPLLLRLMVVAWNLGGAVFAAEWADEHAAPPYLFRSEFPLRDVASLVAELGELQKDVESTLELRCSDKPIQIHLFRTRSSYQSHLRQHVPEGVSRQALFVAGHEVGRVYAYRHRELETDLRHEVTHALLHNALPYVPMWLDEGLAEYFETPPALRPHGSPHRRSLEWSTRFGWRPRLSDLEAKRRLTDFTSRDYRDAWGWVSFMLHGPPEAREALAEYLATIPTGREPTPLSVSLPQRVPRLEAQVLKHLRE